MISDFSNSVELFNKNSLLKDVIDFINFKSNSKLIFLGDTAQLPPVNQTISPALDSKFLKNTYNLNIDEFKIMDALFVILC